MESQPREVPVKELMTRRVLTIQARDSVALAGQVMLWSGIRHLPVFDGADLVGVVTDRDLMRVPHSNQPTPVREVMSKAVQTITLQTPISEAAAKMALGKIDCLPVIEDGRLRGIITATDVLAERGRLIHKGAHAKLPRVSQVMRTNVTALAPEDSLLEAVQRSLLAEVRHFPVIAPDRRVVGMLSDRDLRVAVGDLRAALYESDRRLLSETRVESLMTPNPVTVRVDASLLDVADALVDERIGALPVVDAEDRLRGIVSYIDLLAYLVGRKVDCGSDQPVVVARSA